MVSTEIMKAVILLMCEVLVMQITLTDTVTII